MNVPRPLLVIAIVLIVLGVLSCGAGVIRGRMDAAGPTPRPAVQFEGAGGSAVQPRDVSVAGGCQRNGSTITVAGVCVATVEPQSFRPRTLHLNVTSAGLARVVIRQSIRGATETAGPDPFAGSKAVDVSVGGTSPVDVIVTCNSCLAEITP